MLNLRKQINRYSTRDYVYETIREKIIMLELSPGRSISEKEISEMLEVSRTPVREGFMKLAQEELLEVYPQKGTFVSLIDLNHMEEARFIREHLEKAAVKVASQNFESHHLKDLESNFILQKEAVKNKDYTKLYELDESFHKTIIMGAGKERIWAIIQQMNAHLNRIRMLSLTMNHDWDLILSHHEKIIDAIRKQEADIAHQVMENHLRKLTFEQGKLKQEFPDYFK